MDKAEELKRKITHGLYLTVDKDVADDILEKMQLYADEQSRENAVKFINHLIDKGKRVDLTLHTIDEYDYWKSNKEGSINKTNAFIKWILKFNQQK